MRRVTPYAFVIALLIIYTYPSYQRYSLEQRNQLTEALLFFALAIFLPLLLRKWHDSNHPIYVDYEKLKHVLQETFCFVGYLPDPDELAKFLLIQPQETIAIKPAHLRSLLCMPDGELLEYVKNLLSYEAFWNTTETMPSLLQIRLMLENYCSPVFQHTNTAENLHKKLQETNITILGDNLKQIVNG